MRRQRVESTTVRSVGYQRRSRILEIEFQSGAVYQYVDVSARVYEEFWKAESKGSISTARSGMHTRLSACKGAGQQEGEAGRVQ